MAPVTASRPRRTASQISQIPVFQDQRRAADARAYDDVAAGYQGTPEPRAYISGGKTTGATYAPPRALALLPRPGGLAPPGPTERLPTGYDSDPGEDDYAGSATAYVRGGRRRNGQAQAARAAQLSGSRRTRRRLRAAHAGGGIWWRARARYTAARSAPARASALIARAVLRAEDPTARTASSSRRPPSGAVRSSARRCRRS